MWIIRTALRNPYTFFVLAIVIVLFGSLAGLRTPVDILPDIKLPVISVVWTYVGMPPADMSNRIITYYERQMTTAVTDIDHIESQSLPGVGVVKVFFHPDVNVNAALSEVIGISQTVLKRLPPGHHPAADPELQRLQRSGAAAGVVRQEPHRSAALRPVQQFHPSAARRSRGRRRALTLWRQEPPGAGRSGSGRTAREEPDAG